MIALDPEGRVLMKRDMKLIRKIFVEIQSWEDAQLRTVEIQDVDEAIVARHLEMLLLAGLAEGVNNNAINRSFPTIMIKDLSWAGHNFCGRARE